MNDIPAFPRPFSEDTYLEGVDYLAQDGMTLRDYFAAKALEGMCAGQQTQLFADQIHLAKGAYLLADAMMKAREE